MQLISIEELKEATGYKNTSDVEKCLQRNGVRMMYGRKGHIFTTIEAINESLGLTSNDQQDSIELL